MSTNRQYVEAAARSLLKDAEGLEAKAAAFDERAMDAQKLASDARTILGRLRRLTFLSEGDIRQQARAEEQAWRRDEDEARRSEVVPALARSRAFRKEHGVGVVVDSDEQVRGRREAENALRLASAAAAEVSSEVARLDERQQAVIRPFEEVCEGVREWAGKVAELGGGG